MIGIQYAGGLGNQMFQHGFARILEKKYGVPLGSWHGTPPALRPFPATSLGLCEEDVREPLSVLPEQNSGVQIDPQREKELDLESLGSLLRKGDVLLHGYFQKYHYYSGQVAFFRTLFQMEPVRIEQMPGNEDLVIYMQSYFNVGVDFFLREIPNVPFKKLWIMVNDLERGWEMVGQIRKRFGGCIVHHACHLKDFTFLRLSPRMMLAPSTFAWWAAYLSEATDVVFARPSSGYGSRSHGVASLEITDEARFRYVDYRV
jgi:hypothetical protein